MEQFIKENYKEYLNNDNRVILEFGVNYSDPKCSEWFIAKALGATYTIDDFREYMEDNFEEFSEDLFQEEGLYILDITRDWVNEREEAEMIFWIDVKNFYLW